MPQIADPTGVPIEIAPGQGNLRYTSAPFAFGEGEYALGAPLVGGRIVSFAKIFVSQPWVAAAAMRLLTWSVRVPLKAYERTGENDRRRLQANEHPLAAALVSPWPRGSQAQLVQALLGPMLVHGTSLTEAQSGAKNKIQFLPADWRAVTPIMPTFNEIAGWKVNESGDERIITVDTALQVSYWSPIGPVGVSPLQQLGTTLAVEDGAQRYQRSLLGNSARPPSALQSSKEFLGLDVKKQDEMLANLREDITDIYSGVDNGGKPALLPPGLEWKIVGHSAVEAELIDQRKVAREEVAAVYMIPPPMIGILDKATYCLPSDALIATERGSIPISEVQAGDRVWATTDDGLSLQPVTKSAQTGHKPLVTIRTANRTLRASDNHPVLVARRVKGDRAKRKAGWQREWVPAGSIEVGDLVVTLEELPKHGGRGCPTRAELSTGFAEFCGHYLGNGSMWFDKGEQPAGVSVARDGSARYMDHYREVMAAEFRQLARGGRIDREDRERLPVLLREEERATRFSSRLAAEELVELGLGGTAHTKRVPQWVFELAPDLRAAFVRGFCDADGHVDKRGHLSVSSANEIMLRQLRELFIGLGVPVCNLRASRSWVTLPEGRKIFSVLWSFKAADPVANATIIGSHDPVDLQRMQNGKPWGKKAYKYSDRHAGPPPEITGCGYARVCAVDRGEISVPVYDLTVPGAHNFIAEGVVVHNSNISVQRQMAYTDSLGPPLVMIEQAINAIIVQGLLREPDVFVEFDFSGVLRGDTAKEIEALRNAIGTALLTPNEGRAILNRPPSQQPGADELWMPTNNLQPIGTVPESEDEEEPGTGDVQQEKSPGADS
jgi:HK97 family phage portal protein